MLAIGSSQQTLGWITRRAQAWVTYFRSQDALKDRMKLWNDALARVEQPAFRGMGMNFQIELSEDRDAPPEPLKLGLRLGINRLVEELRAIRSLGVHHVLFNLEGVGRPIPEILQDLAETVMPQLRMATPEPRQ